MWLFLFCFALLYSGRKGLFGLSVWQDIVYLRKPEVCLRKPEGRRKRQVIPSVSTLRKQRANNKFGKVKQSQWPTSSDETLPLDGYRFFPNSTISWIPRIQTDVPALWNISQSMSNTGCLHIRGSFYCWRWNPG